jgi:hypothetical protein
MIVETVSPTPFALLRRGKNFHYREEDAVLQHFSDYDDPVSALTEECKRVLKCISSANESTNLKNSTSLRDASWSRFEDLGFGGFSEEFDGADDLADGTLTKPQPKIQGLRTTPATKTTDLGRPTTPSWADFLSSGFSNEQSSGNAALLLPPDKVLPPINTRSQTSQSHRRAADNDSTLEPGELASITTFNLDDTFWWVWMTSLAGEETSERKAAFGRCALVETNFRGQWLVMEEVIKGASAEPENGAYIAEKKSRFGFSRRNKLTRSKSIGKGALPKADAVGRSNTVSPASKTSIAPDQHARIQAAAAALQQRTLALQNELPASPRRARHNDDMSVKTNSVLTLQPMIMNEATTALQWASKYDKNAIRAKYLGDNFAGRGSNVSLLNGGLAGANGSSPQIASANGHAKESAEHQQAVQDAQKDRTPPLPRKTASPEPRDESTAYPKTNPGLIEVLNKGPPGAPLQQAKPVQQAPAPIIPAAPAVPSKDIPKYDAAPAAIPLSTDVAKPQTPVTQVAPVTQDQGYPRLMERKPVPTIEGKENQPPIDAHQSQDAFNAPLDNSSPESTKHNKLKKKNPPTGFKGIFGRKKPESETVKPLATQRTVSGNSSAVAAARAALEAKAAQSHRVPEPIKVTSKRISTVGNKPGSETIPEPTKAPPAVPEVQNSHVVSGNKNSAYGQGYADRSVTDSEEQRAEQDFRTFDQGPLEDVPAFVPEDSPIDDSADPTQSESIHQYEDDVPTQADAPLEQSDEEESVRPISPNDRWAQIRKNAAERAAVARQSEEQSRRTDRTDDDGESSGEESKIDKHFYGLYTNMY